jgi:hypothetical protein
MSNNDAGTSRGQRIFLLLFILIFFVPAGIGFADKLYMFFQSVGAEAEDRFAEGRFAVIPLMNYLLVFGGMLCLLIWAMAHGMFKDVEAPKYSMLEAEERMDGVEGIRW